MEVTTLSGAEEVLERAGAYLEVAEARHNLPLGILSTARGHPDVHPELRAWVALAGGRVVGAAIRTPPHNLILAQPTDERAVAALAPAIDDELPGVVGAIPEVDRFAAAWTVRHDRAAKVVFDQRIYALTAAAPPAPVPGWMRLAAVADRDLVLVWFRAFSEEVLHRGDNDEDARLQRSVDTRLVSEDTRAARRSGGSPSTAAAASARPGAFVGA